MTAPQKPPRNIGLDLVRVTEVTAIRAGRWIGSGRRDLAHSVATKAMSEALDEVDIDGRIVVGEEGRLGQSSPLDTGRQVGTGDGAEVDVVVDPIDGTKLLIRGHPGALSLVGVAPRGAMRSLAPGVYMEKLVVGEDAAGALVAQCMDAPAAWTLALVARAKDKAVRDLTVIVLDRPRHHHLIEEIRASGARVLLRSEGDAEGALVALMPGGADLLMGIGGVSEGIIAACAVKALGGGMLARLAPQSESEQAAIQNAGLGTSRIYTADDLVQGNQIFFAATGITDSSLLGCVQYHGRRVETHSLLLRSETRTRRFIRMEYLLSDDEASDELRDWRPASR
jgi:fructose-1,6-bisphosphatase II